MFELKNLFEKYFSFDAGVIPMGNSREILLEFKNYIARGVYNRDCPDGYSKISNNEILIMEHFCFDSTTVKKGSESLAELARIERENNIHDAIKCSINMTNYWNNLEENFTQHYLKIKKYKNNLIAEGIATQNTIFKVVFFIEDVTPLGNMDINTKARIYSIFCDKFIDLFENSLDVDYIFDFSEVGSNKKILFVTRSDIKSLRDNEIKIADVKLIPWEPQVRLFDISSPK